MIEQDKAKARKLFRYHSRRVLERPQSTYDHEQRIALAKTFDENEPLQGALADYIFTHWYELAIQEQDIFDGIEHRLTSDSIQKFRSCLSKNGYIQPISDLATRWSVLLMPSSDVPLHKLVMNREDSLQLAQHMSQQLLDARVQKNTELIEQLESEFLSHCMACMDRIAFLAVWMKLSNQDWKFTAKWHDCHDTLNRLARSVRVDEYHDNK